MRVINGNVVTGAVERRKVAGVAKAIVVVDSKAVWVAALAAKYKALLSK